MLSERYEASTPEQIHKLVGLGASFAREQNKFKSSRYGQPVHFFYPPHLRIFESNESQYIMATERRVTGRIGKLAAREWSLRLTDAYWVRHEQRSIGRSAVYWFNWDDKQVSEARRKITLLPADDTLSLVDLVDQVSEGKVDLAPELWSAEEDLSRVTADECSDLIRDVEEVYNRTRLRMMAEQTNIKY